MVLFTTKATSKARRRGVHPTRQARSGATLAAILDAATKQLEAGGLDALSIRELVEVAGCSTGAFYKRFDDKAALLREVHRRFEEEVLALAAGYFEGKAADLSALARELVDFGLEVYRRRGGLVRVFARQAETDGFYGRRGEALLDAVAARVAAALSGAGEKDRSAALENARFAVRVVDACVGRFAVGKATPLELERLAARTWGIAAAALSGPATLEKRKERKP